MQLRAIVLLLASTASLAVAENQYYCDLGRGDAHLLQKPFCCEGGYTKEPHSDVEWIGHGCKENPEFNKERKCPNGSLVTCCRKRVNTYVCSTHAKTNEDDLSPIRSDGSNGQ
ncbi:hypothetical protein BDV59DRAFT_201472 [Aspergillus ambiguus]|uniref:uncharacterized protein n=1 Tax=Aspergillus ambiguus TaxID=176160 RepID=UPI003CCCD797